MKANELRIGNLVEISNNYSLRPKGWEVAHIHAINIDNCIINWDREFFACNYKPFIDSKEPHINPIPLTEEWLERFGLKYNIGSFQLFRNANQEYFITFEDNSALFIKHVHQLQNLYFALTGEELTLKEAVKQ